MWTASHRQSHFILFFVLSFRERKATPLLVGEPVGVQSFELALLWGDPGTIIARCSNATNDKNYGRDEWNRQANLHITKWSHQHCHHPTLVAKDYISEQPVPCVWNWSEGVKMEGQVEKERQTDRQTES